MRYRIANGNPTTEHIPPTLKGSLSTVSTAHTMSSSTGIGQIFDIARFMLPVEVLIEANPSHSPLEWRQIVFLDDHTFSNLDATL